MTDETYDIIFAGGGTCACIAAGRLAAADPTIKILVLEAGPDSRDNPKHTIPAVFVRNVGNPEICFIHPSRPSDALLGRSLVTMSGKAVGGGSIINGMMYARAAASDYDDWENLHENPGWGSDTLFELLKKSETYQAPFSAGVHGTSGPLKVSLAKPELMNNISQEFLRLGGEYDTARGVTGDLDAPGIVDKYGPWAKFIDTETGKRSDTAHHYIYNQDHNKNLTVLTKKRVLRVIFDSEDNRAVGVEYFDNEQSSDITRPAVARASRLVVLSAGAFGSPTILERSGIGAAELLTKFDIPRVVDLPGVGEQYMDHNIGTSLYLASDDAETMDFIFRPSEETKVQDFIQEFQQTKGKSILSTNYMDAGVRMRPNQADLEIMSPAFDERWKKYFAPSPDKPVMSIFAVCTGYPAPPDPAYPPNQKFLIFNYYTNYPVSKGSVHITSANDAYAPVNFYSGMLDQPEDLPVLRWGYKKTRELTRRSKFYRGELTAFHPPFPPISQAAARMNVAGPVALSAPEIVYTAEDDAVIDEFHRKSADEHIARSTGHSMGTCAMKPREKGGVVDPRLNVYGVKGLKIADLSIAPTNVGANTYSTAIAVGERAAILIAEDLGISGV